MLAPVNRIIPFSNVDGPGNRCSIFFQKCPFKCLYCHNPETINECIACGACVKTCPVSALSLKSGKVVWNKKKCIQCDTCIHTCTHLSSPKIEWLSVEDVVKIVKKQKDFIRGITVSGGECMEHADFLLELFKQVKKLGLTCLIDSNGFYDFNLYPSLLEVCDGVMLDVKAYDDQFHIEITGQSNEIVLKNLIYLSKIGKLEEVRTVMLPKYSKQNQKTVDEVTKIISKDCKYKLLRYRPFGVRDEGLNVFGNTIPSESEINRIKKIGVKNGATNIQIV